VAIPINMIILGINLASFYLESSSHAKTTIVSSLYHAERNQNNHCKILGGEETDGDDGKDENDQPMILLPSSHSNMIVQENHPIVEGQQKDGMHETLHATFIIT